jgi:hypothetical protein
MWAPRRIADCELPIANFPGKRLRGTGSLIQSKIGNRKNLKSLRVPVRLLQAPSAGIFEKLVNRREQHARPLHVEPDIEVEFVIEEMNIAMAEHAEERAGCFEVIGMDDSLIDLKRRTRLVSNAVSAARNDKIENS